MLLLMDKIYRWLVMLYTPDGVRKKASEYSAYEIAKGKSQLKKNILRSIRNACLLTLGIFSAAFGLKSFLLPNKFIDGGATGISLLTSALSSVHVSVLLVLVNIPFVLLGYKTIGRTNTDYPKPLHYKFRRSYNKCLLFFKRTKVFRRKKF